MDQFRGLFDKLDQNNDGFISKGELHSEMKKHGILSAEGKVQNIIESYDLNQDGRLDYTEFLSYMMDREKKWKITFQHLDRDQCGVIDQDDIVSLFQGLGVAITKGNAKQIIQMMDKDDSLTVDWSEFLQHVIINPAENLCELVSSWKHNVVFDVGESRAMSIEFSQEPGVWSRFVLSAGLADAVSRTVTAPIDRLKTQLQAHGSKRFSQGLQELRSGGVRSMWQGNAVNVLKGTPQSTLQCLIYAQMKAHTQGQSRGQSQGLTVQQRFALGCISGAVAHAAFYPLEVLKVRLNLLQSGTYRGVVACARSIYANESPRSFYRGFWPSLLCMIPYAGVECAVHQSIMNWAKSNPAYNGESALFFFSFVAFASGQMTSYPLAVIRTQRQAEALSPASRRPAGVLNGLVGIYERSGFRGFYNGMGASFARALPCASINYLLIRKFETIFSPGS